MSLWQDAQQRFSELQQREKVLVLAVSLFCICYLSIWFLILPMTAKQADFKRQINGLEASVAAAKMQQQALQQALTIDYKAQVQEKIKAQQGLVTKLDLQLQQLSRGFVAADKMPQVLADILAGQPGLQLIEFKVTGMQAVMPQAATEAAEPVKNVLYKHGMELKISGDYFGTRAYLQRLEQAPLQVLITGFHYRVTDYPMGELTLNLATVSANETFIIL
ncbi:hypothetical protein WCN91_06525 [Pseudoalteromonas sp. YIC-827]|uniref:MSHA biogenesis protein MshJ n=1 Tax=Pseudoalteromonas qingdaonensis TaxID=3131913 RepID=A0ABU9MUX0_9GAMM